MLYFNPFDPFAWIRAFTPPPPLEREAPIPEGTPIAIEASSTDPGIALTVQKDSDAITLRGKAEGQIWVGDDYYGYGIARGLGLTLDIDRAPTRDIFGHTTYREKNQRLFSFTTHKGDSARHVAESLAEKINARDDFKATVRANRDGSVTLQFARR